MQNFYAILGVSKNASSQDINAALRRLVRRYNEETTHGSRDLTEALKFINRARLTFANPERRAQYDAELELIEAEAAKAEAAKEAAKEAAAAAAAAATETTITRQAKALKPVSDNRTGATTSTRPSQTAHAPTQPMAAPGFQETMDPLDLDSLILPITLDSNQMTFGGTAKANPGMGQDLGSVLTNPGKTKQRSTAPNPTLRFAARIIDYGLWGLLLGLIWNYLSSIDIISPTVAQIVGSPFIAPILITLSWAFVEGSLLIFFPATPGKYFFDIRVATNVSNPYAHNDPNTLITASFFRALRIWWRGVGCGVIPVYFFAMGRAHNTLITAKETSWDFDGDCLVTHGEIPAFKVMIASTLLGAVIWMYTSAWATPFQHTLQSGWNYAAKTTITTLEAWKILKGDMPTYGTEFPAAPAKENRTVTLENTAQGLIDKQDWNALLAHCSAWTKEDERNVTAWFCYGRALHKLDDNAGAIVALKRASLLAPQNDDIRRVMKDASSIEMQKKLLLKRRTEH
ncbi:MAG: DnaJ domain-containing protein [Pseudomonadota bacterium]